MYKYTLTKNSIGVLDSIESKMRTANFLVLFTRELLTTYRYNMAGPAILCLESYGRPQKSVALSQHPDSRPITQYKAVCHSRYRSPEGQMRALIVRKFCTAGIMSTRGPIPDRCTTSWYLALSSDDLKIQEKRCSNERHTLN